MPELSRIENCMATTAGMFAANMPVATPLKASASLVCAVGAGQQGQAQVGSLLQVRAQLFDAGQLRPAIFLFQGQIAAAVLRPLFVVTEHAVAGVMNHMGLEALECLADGVEGGVVQIERADLPGPFGLVQRLLDGPNLFFGVQFSLVCGRRDYDQQAQRQLHRFGASSPNS